MRSERSKLTLIRSNPNFKVVDYNKDNKSVVDIEWYKNKSIIPDMKSSVVVDRYGWVEGLIGSRLIFGIYRPAKYIDLFTIDIIKDIYRYKSTYTDKNMYEIEYNAIDILDNTRSWAKGTFFITTREGNKSSLNSLIEAIDEYKENMEPMIKAYYEEFINIKRELINMITLDHLKAIMPYEEIKSKGKALVKGSTHRNIYNLFDQITGVSLEDSSNL